MNAKTKSDNRKALPKFVITILLAALGGGILGFAAGIVNAINDVHAGVGYNKLRLHIRTAFICPEAADIRLQHLTGGYFSVPVRAVKGLGCYGTVHFCK